MNIAYYVSGHGFGHVSRSFVIVEALKEIPEIEKIFFMTTREKFLSGNHEKIELRKVQSDPELAQKTSISLDTESTKQNILEFEKRKNNLIEEEIYFLQKNKIDLIISDSASLPFIISKKLNVPSIFIGNFTWDFIFANFAKNDQFFGEYSNLLKSEYRNCDEGLILPFYCPIESISKTTKVGIVGRSPVLSKKKARAHLNFQDKFKYFLFSFGAYGVGEEVIRLDLLKDDYKIVVSGYEGFRSEKILKIENIDYPDLIAACDFVVTKPGYGILSETYLANTPVIYTDRGDFAEVPYLVEAMNIYHNSHYITNEDFFHLNFEKSVLDEFEHGFQKKRKALVSGIPDILKKILELGKKKL